jgi:hypothetical protein
MAKQETVPFFWKYGGMLQSLSLRLPNLIPDPRHTAIVQQF